MKAVREMVIPVIGMQGDSVIITFNYSDGETNTLKMGTVAARSMATQMLAITDFLENKVKAYYG